MKGVIKIRFLGIIWKILYLRFEIWQIHYILYFFENYTFLYVKRHFTLYFIPYVSL